MEDLTQGSIPGNIIKMSSFMLVTMVFQTLYYLVDLYFVGRLGREAVAAVSVAGNLMFIVLALSQMLGVGTTALVSHAVGAKDKTRALLLFNQSQVMAAIVGLLFLIVGLALMGVYSRTLAADAQTARLAESYLYWFIPAMALQFAMVATGAALRGVGNFRPGMIVSTATVIINMVLAPILITGWGLGFALGVAGAALASLIAVSIGVVWLTIYVIKHERYLQFAFRDWKPQIPLWGNMLKIGMPVGVEFGLMAVYLFIIYGVCRPFGAAAQAGFGIGLRVVQVLFMPVVALGFAVAPVAGQNFGARQAGRVRETFTAGVKMATALTIAAAIICQVAPQAMIGFFSKDPQVIAVGEEYLRIISFTFIASGITFVSSSMFQGLGNTVPPMLSSFLRILVLAIPTLLLAQVSGFNLRWVWYLTVASVTLQMGANLILLFREFHKRLNFPAEPTGATAISTGAA